MTFSEVEMRAFDALPKSIRKFLREFAHPLSSIKVLEFYHVHGEEKTLRQLELEPV
jgi:hypothetical protein